jgi:hypothetical protein
MKKVISIPLQCAHRVTCINYKKGNWVVNILGICNDHACNYPHLSKPVDNNRLCSDPFQFPDNCPLKSV